MQYFLSMSGLFFSANSFKFHLFSLKFSDFIFFNGCIKSHIIYDTIVLNINMTCFQAIINSATLNMYMYYFGVM